MSTKLGQGQAHLFNKGGDKRGWPLGRPQAACQSKLTQRSAAHAPRKVTTPHLVGLVPSNVVARSLSIPFRRARGEAVAVPAWRVLAVVSFGYLLASWAMNPVSAILPTITADLDIDVARAGWLMNAYFVCWSASS